MDPVGGHATSQVLAGLSDVDIDTIVAHTAPAAAPPQIMLTGTRHLGGAIDHGDSPVGRSLRGAAFVANAVAVVPTPDATGGAAAALAALRADLTPSATGTAYLNFLEGEERRQRASQAVTVDAWRRLGEVRRWLGEVRRRLDPDGVMAYGVDPSAPAV